MSIDWVFPPSGGGSDAGFNDAGIETFTGARFDGLAREIIQNSLDASDGNGTPVAVEFKFVKITRDEFPGADTLFNAIKICLKESEDEKGKEFFKQAGRVLLPKVKEIECLKISDSGTTGLRGDYIKRKGQWHAITKGQGITDKKGQGITDKSDSTAGGSYGIGKNAPFTVSKLRTVFYSTRYEEKGETVYRAQGKSILKSYSMDGGEYTQGTGFYGITKGCMPLDNDNIPEILRPEKEGCMVFVPGFIHVPKWKDIIAATVASNFFCAIDQGKLRVLIDDEKRAPIVVEKSSLEQCFQNAKELTIDKKLTIDAEKIKNSHHYYQAMKSAGHEKNSELSNLGHCKIWVSIEEGLPKRVALLRKTGMLITDRQKGFPRWGEYADFVAVFMCDSEKGNKLLRQMENPRHDAFEPERAIEKRRKICHRALKELRAWVKDCVGDLAKSKETETTSLDELKNFFPDRDIPESVPGDGEPDIEGKPTYSIKPLKRVKPAGVWDGVGDDGGASDGDGSGGDGPGDGTGQGDGSSGTGQRDSNRVVELKNVRIVSDDADIKKKTVYFTPMKSGKINVILAIMGDDGSTERISIKDDDNDFITVNVKGCERMHFSVTMKDAVRDSIAVKAFQEVTKNFKNENTAD